MRRGYRNLETVFPGVAAAGDETGYGLAAASDIKLPTGHEHQLLDAGAQAQQDGDGLRALQRQQGHLGHRDDLAARADFGLDVRDVADLAGAIDDHKNVAAVGIVAVHEHQVVDDAALVIEQQAVALLADAQVDHIDRHQALEGGAGVGAHQAQLAHVGHVKQARQGAGVVVLGHQAGGVLHRHRVTGKRHHAGAQRHMQVVQRYF